MLHLATLGSPIGSHLGGWRHPDAFDDSVSSLDAGIEMAELAERGLFDMVFLADGNGVRALDQPRILAANVPSSRPGWYEPTTYLSAIAMRTRHLGLVATATTSLEEPYSIARKFASLDKLSGGRAGWNVVTTGMAEEALNFSQEHLLPRDQRYARARESVDVVCGLWDSWAADAFVHDKLTGQYLDPTKMRTLDHKGVHFQVRGPLNVARSPQGRPIVFSAGQSEEGKEFAAQYADCMFAKVKTKAEGISLCADVKSRMGKYGRETGSLRIMPGVLVNVAETAGEATRLMAELDALISPELGVDVLSREVGIDLTQYPIDGPMPRIEGERPGANSSRLAIGAMAERECLSIRQTYARVTVSSGNPLFQGSARDVADEIEDWHASEACDGFVLHFPVLPTSLSRFVDLVVPELQRRGIFRHSYAGPTLRENLGLDLPPSRF